MQIELVKIGEVVKEGKWPKMNLEYIRDGKNATRKLVAVGETGKVMKALQGCSPGDHVEIEMVKDGEYWNWVGLTPVAKDEAKKTSYQEKSRYETPEERALRQVYIVRQSSLTSAMKFYELRGTKFTFEDTIALADEFVNYVFNGNAAPMEAEKPMKKDPDFDYDIPF
jgi:hypothetical protein